MITYISFQAEQYTHLKMKELIPHPFALIQSMRNMGYRPHTALADIIDNSIAAGAKNIFIDFNPSNFTTKGWVLIADDGKGMSHEQLHQAMRWGGNGPNTPRNPEDLGRFGLGLKTASFSMGKRLTVISRQNGIKSILRWDLDTICSTGKWTPEEHLDSEESIIIESLIQKSEVFSKDGTIVFISQLDRLNANGNTISQIENNRTAIIKTIIHHLSLVFHRFLEKKKLELTFGSMKIQPWNLFGRCGKKEESSWIKNQEKLSDGTVSVKTFIIPHHKALTPEEHMRLSGPSGWNAHQGFFFYRADRMIMSGGWLNLSKSEEHCKLARIIIDLPNNVDEFWGLDVIKSKIVPPVILRAELERIARAARSEAMKRYRFHGEKEAPSEESEENIKTSSAFWSQKITQDGTVFKINKSHPLVEAIYQEIKGDKEDALRTADAFLYALERLLPVSAILQQPAKSTQGLKNEPTEDELDKLLLSFGKVVEVYKKIGDSTPVLTALSCLPYCNHAALIKQKLNIP